MKFFNLLELAALPSLVHSFASTDSIQDIDTAQTGYLPNHNIDPNAISSYGILWKQALNSLETLYAKPLTYTPAGYTNELVITVSNQNIIRISDGITGMLVNNRTLDPPFQSVDVNCGDVSPTIGIVGTPIIDPATDTMYFFSKGYKGAVVGPAGTLAGQYKFYAVHIPTLTDVSGFPISLEGMYANNDPTRYFVGGVVLQKTALAMVGNSVIAGFSGHCDNFNYTGLLVSVSKTSGVGVTDIYATEASPGAPSPQALLYTNQNGGKAGIWQTGSGFPVLGNQVYFVTGNGEGAANGAVPASGRTPLSTLEQCVANFYVDPSSGLVSQTDYFEPYEYAALDAGDRDFGSAGSQLLDPSTFYGTGVDRIIVAGGKSGKLYILNADNLGGYAQGPGGSDNVLQTIVNSGSFYSTSGSYPLEGGYIYFNPTRNAIWAYQFGRDSTGKPLFTVAGNTSATYNGDSPVITTLKGQPGTAILWVTDTNKGLLAFNAIPVNGVLQPINLPATGGITKFQRPVFGNGRVYTTGAGYITAIGGPVTLPLNCSSPVNFGSLSVGSTTTASVTCVAKTALTIAGGTTTLGVFTFQNSSLPTTVASGSTFSFPVTWDLTSSSINQAQTQGQIQILPGLQTAALDLYTNSISGYSNLIPIKLQGTITASVGYLVINATQVDFGGIVLGGPYSTSSGAVALTNQGTASLSFTGFAWQDVYATGSPYQNVTVASASTVGNGFTATQFPTVGSTLAPGQSLTIPLTFSATTNGTWGSVLSFWSNGGWTDVLLTGTAASAPAANITISDGQGNWLSSTNMAFGNVSAGTTATRQIRICDTGASALTITVSQPPSGAILTALDPALGLRQGSTIDVSTCSYGTVQIIAPPIQPNHPSIPVSGSWVLNTNGVNGDGSQFGVHTISITGTVVSRQVGPLEANGQGVYQFLGCFSDNVRNLQTSTTFTNNSIEACMGYCAGLGYAYSGTEYHTECWCGNKIVNPATLGLEQNCNYNCPGDVTEICGGSGLGGGGGFLYAYYNQNQINPSSIFPSSTSSSITSRSTSSSVVVSITSSSSRVSSTSSVVSSSSSTISSSSSVSTSSGLTSSSSSASSSASSSSSSSSSISSSTSSSSSNSSTSSSLSITSSSSVYSSSSTTSTSSSATPSSSLNPFEPATISTFNYVGCYFDNVNGFRTLPLGITAFDPMTLEACAANCVNYEYFGTEYGRECYCGYTLDPTLKAPESDCSMYCSGSSAELCGNGNRLSTFKNTIYKSPPIHVPTVGPYTFLQCYTEGTSSRALTGAAYANSLMTVEMCSGLCSGYNYFGVEYSAECYCGNTLQAGSVPVTLSSCSMLCDGNSTEYCGGPNRLDMYTLTSLISTSSSIVVSSTSSSLVPSSSSIMQTSSSSVLSSSSSISVVPSSSSVGASLTGSTVSSSSSVVVTSTSSSQVPSSSQSSLTVASSSSPSSSSSIQSAAAPSSSSTQVSSSSIAPSTSSSTVQTSSSPSSFSSAAPSTNTAQSSSSSSALSSSSSTVQTSSSSSTFSSAAGSSSSTALSSSSSSSTASSAAGSSSSTAPSSSSTPSSSAGSSSSTIPSSPSTSSSSTPSTLQTITTPTGPSTNPATTTTSLSTLLTSTSFLPTASATSGFNYTYIGCISDTPNTQPHALSLLFSNKSVTPELCGAYVKSLALKPTPTYLPYFAVEYHQECYGGSMFSFGTSASVTSLTGSHACTDICSGSIGAATTGTAMCGGPLQMNVYANGGTVSWPGPVITQSV